MRTQFVLIACLAIAKEVFGTQVYETPNDSSQQQWQPWKNQDSIQTSNGDQEKYHPITFDASDTQQKETQQPLLYNANIQSGSSKVANVVGQQSSLVRILSPSKSPAKYLTLNVTKIIKSRNINLCDKVLYIVKNI